MRVVFMGTPSLAATVLEKLADAFDVVGVYSRPDAVRGRGKKLEASPVKQTALEREIDVFTPETLRDAEVLDELRSLNPDVICVAAYGSVLPPEALEIPRYGCLNVHTSLLPRWRGTAPMQRAILERDDNVGVCIMRMEEGLDTGPYCKRVEFSLDDMYLDDVERALSEAGADALVEALEGLESDGLVWTEQPESGVTYAAKIEKSELALDVDDTAAGFCAKVRASSPAHPAHAQIAGRGVTVVRASCVEDEQGLELSSELQPGEGVFRAKRLFVMASDAPVEIEMLKPDGKKIMDARSFAAGIQGIKNSTITWGKA